MLRPCCSSQGHGTARPSKDGLWATCLCSASSGYHAELHEGCYQKHINFRCRWPVWNQTMFVMGKEKSGSSTLQKKNDLLNCWTSSSDISGYHAVFHKGHGIIGAWQGCGMACYMWIGLKTPEYLTHFSQPGHCKVNLKCSELAQLIFKTNKFQFENWIFACNEVVSLPPIKHFWTIPT